MHDLIILGAGPGGYVAAQRAGRAGLKVLLVEKAELGGVCLNAGCIPTKTLLAGAKSFAHLKEAEAFGVAVEKPVFHLDKAMARKARVVDTLRKGIAASMKRFGVEVAAGAGLLRDNRTVEVAGTRHTGKAVIIATGSSPAVPPIPGVDRPWVLTSTGVLDIRETPKNPVIVGGGYIGMEFASLFDMIGSQVTVVEMMPEIVPGLEPEFAAQLRKAMPGVTFELGARVEEFGDHSLTFSRGDKKTTLPADLTLLSIGRVPNLEGMGFREAGLDMDRKGIRTDERMRTNLPGVYAIGDVTGRSLLAHSASRMGEIAVADILGKRDRWRGHAVPWVVFTNPEVAGCGLTQAEAEARGLEVKTVTAPMRVSGRYLAEHPRENGICKIVADKKTDVILGVSLLGSGCSELIFGAALMIEAELRTRDVREMVFPHPTVSEVLREALFEME